MSIFKEIPPTAGFPVYTKDIFSLFKINNPPGILEDDFKDYLGVPYAAVTYSGTAALYLILECIKEVSPKRSIIIPAFVCPLVPLAITRAGFKVKVCDTQRDNFGFDLEKLERICLDDEDILAIVAVHLAGIPIDIDSVKQISGKKQIFIIEDCAQSLGAEYKGKKVGTLGDFAFFSLCRGKGLTIYEGGLIVTSNKEFAPRIDATIKYLVKNNFISEGLKILELIGYWIFYRPRLFWFVFKLPQIFWSLQGNNLKSMGEYYTSGFSIHKVSAPRKSFGHSAFCRLEHEIEEQRKKVLYYQEALRQIKGIKPIKENPYSKATYPYLTIIYSDINKCRQASDSLSNLRLGVSMVYASAVPDYDYLKKTVGEAECPNARRLAKSTITLSTSTFMKKSDIDAVTAKIKILS